MNNRKINKSSRRKGDKHVVTRIDGVNGGRVQRKSVWFCESDGQPQKRKITSNTVWGKNDNISKKTPVKVVVAHVDGSISRKYRTKTYYPVKTNPNPSCSKTVPDMAYSKGPITPNPDPPEKPEPGIDFRYGKKRNKYKY